MKSTIQAEAEKAAKKIREALEEFGEATDYEMMASAQWVTAQAIHDAESGLSHIHREVQVECRIKRIDRIEAKA